MRTGRAWDEPATRRAWRRTVCFRCAVLVCCLLGLCAWLFAVVTTPAWLLVLWLPVLCAGLWYTLLAASVAATLPGVRRVLRVYPWQADGAEVSVGKGRGARFTVADPERVGKAVRLGHGGVIGTGRHFWVRAARSGRCTTAWFAGDPRYVAVVATPGPGNLLRVAQREALDSRMSPRSRGVSAEARARARAAGARVGGA